jgi:hypothetical protein
MAASPEQDQPTRDALYAQIALTALVDEDLGIDEPRDDDPPLYFQLPRSQQPSESHLGQAERDLAAAIVRGRTLVHRRRSVEPFVRMDIAVDAAYLTDVSSEILDDPEACVDTIVDVLQVARVAGWDGAELCRFAIALQRIRRAKALVDARRLRGAP